MAAFFPQVTGTFKLEEPPALRRFSMSILEMAVVTGIVLRLYRAVTLTAGPNDALFYPVVMFVIGLAFLFGMAALHLGNYTVRHWLWRAPAFAALEGVTEALTSLALVALHREPMGSARATFADWPQMAAGTLFWRIVAVVLFAALLAGTVQVMRRWLAHRDRRDDAPPPAV